MKDKKEGGKKKEAEERKKKKIGRKTKQEDRGNAHDKLVEKTCHIPCLLL